MAGISSNLYSQLRRVLMDCGPFGSNEQLQAVFAHPKLKPWRASVPEAPTRADRVDRTLYELAERRNTSGENALVLFLHASSDKLESDAECHQRLLDVARELAEAVGMDTTALVASSTTVKPPRPDQELVNEIEELVSEDKLKEALKRLSSLAAYRQETTLLNQRLNRTRARERQGTITHDDADAEYTKIAKAILDLLS